MCKPCDTGLCIGCDDCKEDTPSQVQSVSGLIRLKRKHKHNKMYQRFCDTLIKNLSE